MKAARAKVQRRQMATNEREKDQDSKGPVKDQKDQWKQWMKAEREKDQGSTVSACPALNKSWGESIKLLLSARSSHEKLQFKKTRLIAGNESNWRMLQLGDTLIMRPLIQFLIKRVCTNCRGVEISDKEINWVKRVHVSSSDTVAGEGWGGGGRVCICRSPQSGHRPPSAVDSVSGAGPANDPAVSWTFSVSWELWHSTFWADPWWGNLMDESWNVGGRTSISPLSSLHSGC